MKPSGISSVSLNPLAKQSRQDKTRQFISEYNDQIQVKVNANCERNNVIGTDKD